MSSKEELLSMINTCLTHIAEVRDETITLFRNHQMNLVLSRRDFAKDNIQIILAIISGILIGDLFKPGLIGSDFLFGVSMFLALFTLVLNLTYWQHATEKDIFETGNSYNMLMTYFQETTFSLNDLQAEVANQDYSERFRDRLAEIMQRPDEVRNSKDDFLKISNFLTITSLLIGFASLNSFGLLELFTQWELLLFILLLTWIFSFYSHGIVAGIIKPLFSTEQKPR